MEGDGLRAEGEFLVLYDFCRERLENRVLDTALVSCCSAQENHEGGEYNIMVLAAVQADLLSTTQHRQNSGRLLFGIACHMLVQRGGHFLCSRSLFFSSSPSLLLLSYFLLWLGKTDADCTAVENYGGEVVVT